MSSSLRLQSELAILLLNAEGGGSAPVVRLIFSTNEFVYAGRPRPGFPILLGQDLRPIQPFHAFLMWKLLASGPSLSQLTWEAYGRRLWDFVCFIHANKLHWDRWEANGKSALIQYRNWSLHELKLSSRTVNARLRILIEFFEWALKNKMINQLPFEYIQSTEPAYDAFLMHLNAGGTNSLKTDVTVSDWGSIPQFLSLEQIGLVRSCNFSLSRKLLLELMIRVGLRSVEARTFAKKYVFNPSQRKDCAPNRMIRIRLDPRDMSIKFNKPRDVDIPFSLMSDLHAYTLHERNRLLTRVGEERSALILTVGGREFTKDGVGEVCRDVSQRVGFKVTALMLRHSYAVHTLRRLRETPTFYGEPLLYLRDRLGHESVQTTTVYLRQIDQLTGGLALAVEDEFDAMFQTPTNTAQTLDARTNSVTRTGD